MNLVEGWLVKAVDPKKVAVAALLALAAFAFFSGQPKPRAWMQFDTNLSREGVIGVTGEFDRQPKEPVWLVIRCRRNGSAPTVINQVVVDDSGRFRAEVEETQCGGYFEVWVTTGKLKDPERGIWAACSDVLQYPSE